MPSKGVHAAEFAPTLVSDSNALFQTVMPCLRLQWHGTAAAPGARIVHHDRERRHRDPRFASSPSARGAAGRGHRRGLDGRVDAKTYLKDDDTFPRECCLPPGDRRHGAPRKSKLTLPRHHPARETRETAPQKAAHPPAPRHSQPAATT